ncbi:MAG: glycosyltransferase family 2 protein [Clostridium sp.]|nr:glycosyltransferase family 2 protein [Clostridium sp.]
MMRRFLPSVVSNTEGAEIVVADNGSDDDSLMMLESEFPSVRIVPFDRNLGFAEGYNRAIGIVESEYIVLLNSDVETPEGWLSPLVKYMDANPDVAACQPKLLAFNDKDSFEYAGGAGGFLDRFGYPFCRGRVFGVVEKDHGQYDDVCDIHWATGACMMVRRSVYLESGGLDGRFFAHNEEIDLCWRMRLFGCRVVCVPWSHVYHLGGGTLPQGNPRKTYLNFRNNLTMLYKNLPDRYLYKVMRWRLVLDYVAMLQSLLKGNVADIKAIYAARKDFNAWKSDYLHVRKRIQERACENERGNKSLTVSYSILVKYYLLGKRCFSEL